MSSTDAAVLFDGPRLSLARQLAGLRKSELAYAIGKSPTAIGAWEGGLKRPSSSTVAELSICLGVDPSFFAVNNGGVTVPTSPAHFRSLRSTTQLARDQAVAYGQMVAAIASGLETHIEYPSVEIPNLAADVYDQDCDTPELAAREVRQAWNLGDGPIGHLLRLLENHGVLVVFSPPQAATVDAYSFDSSHRPVMILNPLKRDYYRQRFDMAHELGHLVMHAEAEPGGKTVEHQAHRFASELLMPAEKMVALLPTIMGPPAWLSLARLKEEWGVSIQALLFRARTLGMLGEVSYRNAMTTVSARGWRRSEPGQVQTLEQPSLLPRAVELLYDEGCDEKVLASQCRAPLGLFRSITGRVPRVIESASVNPHGAVRKVVSLLPNSQ